MSNVAFITKCDIFDTLKDSKVKKSNVFVNNRKNLKTKGMVIFKE